MDLLAQQVLASPASSVTFSSLGTIAAGYRDLMVTLVGGASSPDMYAFMRFNGDAGTYNYVFANGNGSTTASSGPGDNKIQLGGRASYFTGSLETLVQVQIFDFAQTDKHKSQLVRFNSPNRAVEMMASRWASTSAIISINLVMNTGNWLAGSTFTLYGIKA